jgi:hypothetical protein
MVASVILNDQTVSVALQLKSKREFKSYLSRISKLDERALIHANSGHGWMRHSCHDFPVWPGKGAEPGFQRDSLYWTQFWTRKVSKSWFISLTTDIYAQEKTPLKPTLGVCITDDYSCITNVFLKPHHQIFYRLNFNITQAKKKQSFASSSGEISHYNSKQILIEILYSQLWVTGQLRWSAAKNTCLFRLWFTIYINKKTWYNGKILPIDELSASRLEMLRIQSETSGSWHH